MEIYLKSSSEKCETKESIFLPILVQIFLLIKHVSKVSTLKIFFITYVDFYPIIL